MTSSPITSPEKFSEVKTRANDLWALCQTKQPLMDALEKIFLMKSTKTAPVEGVKEAISQDGRVAALGGARLLSGGDPLFKVEPDEKLQIDESKAGMFETGALKMWKKSSEITDKDVVKDLSLAAVLFGEPHVMIVDTAKILDAATKSTSSKARKKQADLLVKATPILFKAASPRNGIAVRNGMGMSEYYRRDRITIANVRGLYVDKNFGNHKDTETVDVSEYWSLDNHCVWIEGDQVPLMFEEHDLPAIPVYVSQADGSVLFEDVADQNQPLLFAFHKAGLYERITEAQTIAWTKTMEFGASPTMWVEGVSKTDKIRMDFKGAVPVGYTPQGSKIHFPNREILSPELFQLLEDARQRTQEATIYGQTLGAPLGSDATFSLTALLSTAGRLPLIAPAQAVSRCLTNATKIAFAIMADSGTKHPLFGDEKLPEDIDVTASVEIKLPQDMPKNAAIVAQLRGIMPDTWLMENLLNVTDTDKMRRQVTQQKFYEMYAGAKIEAMVAQAVQKLQPPVPPEGGAVPPGGEGMPPVPPEGGGNPQEQIPPEIMQQMMAAQGGGQLPAEMQPGSPAAGVPLQQPPNMPMGGM